MSIGIAGHCDDRTYGHVHLVERIQIHAWLRSHATTNLPNTERILHGCYLQTQTQVLLIDCVWTTDVA